MSSTPDDIRVRLSQIGANEVVDALRRVGSQTDKTARQATSAVAGLNKTMGGFKSLVASLGVGLSVAGLVAFGKSVLSTADDLGKAAIKTGTAVEDLSAINTTARLANVGLDQLTGGIVKLNKATAELADGNKEAEKSFARLGLSAKDLKGLNPAQVFELVSKRIFQIPDAAHQAQAALGVLGKSAADLLPAMKDLAEQGLAGATEQAQRFGTLITGDLANAAQQANDSFTTIKLQAEGLGTAFVSGLAPSIVAALGDISKSIEGDGVKEMQRFGQETGRILRVVIEVFKLVGTVVGGILSGMAEQVGAFAATVNALAHGNFSQAISIWRDAGQRSDKESAEFSAKIKAQLAKVVEVANSEAPAIVVPVKAKLDPKVLAEIKRLQDKIAAEEGKPAADAAARKALAEAEKLAREQAKLDKDRQEAEKAAGETRLAIENRILELTGQERDAKIAALDAELAKQREVLEKAGGLTLPDSAKLERVLVVEIQKIDFEDSVTKAHAALEDLANQRARIEQDVELGITTQLEGQTQIAAIEAARLPVLQELAAATMAAAQATGDPALIQQAEALALAIGQVSVSVHKAADGMAQFREQAKEAVTNDLANWLSDGIEGAKNLGDAFKSLALSIIQSLQRIAAEILAQKIIESLGSLFGGMAGGAGGAAAGTAGGAAEGGPVARVATGGSLARFAIGGPLDARGGGRIKGPGTATSDSIIAVAGGRALRLANTEFIVRGSSANAPGMPRVLEDINAGRLKANQIRRRFAGGGALEGAAQQIGGPNAGVKQRQAGFAGVLGLEPGLVLKHLETEDFDRLLIRRIGRNPNAIRKILG